MIFYKGLCANLSFNSHKTLRGKFYYCSILKMKKLWLRKNKVTQLSHIVNEQQRGLDPSSLPPQTVLLTQTRLCLS